MKLVQQIRWMLLHQIIRHRFPDVRSLSTKDLATWLNQSARKKPLLLDTRSPEEFAISHLPTAEWLDPKTDNFSAFKALQPDTPIVTYCSVGVRSAAIASRLQAEGFTNVMNLQGSIFQWANEGRSVYRNGNPVKQVHPYDPNWGRLLKRDLHVYEPKGENRSKG